MPADGTVPQFIFISSSVKKRRLRILLCLIQFIGYKRMPHYICLLGKKGSGESLMWCSSKGFSGLALEYRRAARSRWENFCVICVCLFDKFSPGWKVEKFYESIFRSDGISAEPAFVAGVCGIASWTRRHFRNSPRNLLSLYSPLDKDGVGSEGIWNLNNFPATLPSVN